MSEDHKAVFVYTTWPSEEAAATAGRELVEHALAACVNIVPRVTSIYRWDGQVCADREAVMIVKTIGAAVPAVEAAIRARHPATTPAIAVLPVVGGGADFLAWIEMNASGRR
ncbi:MAG: divalent-cation tolerance protein CutA [Hyphomicrobiaceae bacterium]